MNDKTFVATDYLKYRSALRNYDLALIEKIVRYFDTETGRRIAIGEHGNKPVMIPYEENPSDITPITIHATSRQQIKFRLNTGRFIYE